MENTSFPTEEERDENLFVTQNAVEAILSWKAHQIRVVHQDECRLQVIEKLSENTAHCAGFCYEIFASRIQGSPVRFFLAKEEYHGTFRCVRGRRMINLNLKPLYTFLNQDFKIALLWYSSWSMF